MAIWDMKDQTVNAVCRKCGKKSPIIIKHGRWYEENPEFLKWVVSEEHIGYKTVCCDEPWSLTDIEEVEMFEYTTETGQYLVIQITGSTWTYIAEVIKSKPLEIKVQESGPYARLKNGDFIILREKTEQLQKDVRENTNIFLESEKQMGRKVISGLKSLGVTDNKLHDILPD